MLRLVAFLLAVLAASWGLGLLADHPGTLTFEWLGYRGEATMFQAVVGFVIALGVGVIVWNIVLALWRSPGAVGQFITRRRERRGLDALSDGILAIGAGDKQSATRAALLARKSLPNEPLTHLLRAQAAQLHGDRATARRIFEAMLASPDTEQTGLRGLFIEAQQEAEPAAARQFAERALAQNPALVWPVEALFDLQCRDGDWDAALATLDAGRRHGHVERATADRRRAVLLAAKAQDAEHTRTDDALTYAREAHKLAPDLIPAAAVAGRILAGKGQTSQAAKILERTFKLAPHPDLATAYAHARVGDSVSDRLDRLRTLAKISPDAAEGRIALAIAAIDAREWQTARDALAPLTTPERLSQRVAMLMARIEKGDKGDAGRVREWLARAVHAERDPAWTADGVVSDTWAPVSPMTHRFDAFCWRVPVASSVPPDAIAMAEKTERVVALATPDVVDAVPSGASRREAIDVEAAVRTVVEDVPMDAADADVSASATPLVPVKEATRPPTAAPRADAQAITAAAPAR